MYIMWISVFASLVCFAVATFLFTPALRKHPFYRVFSIYFIFEGLWMVLNWAYYEIFLDEGFMILIQYIGTIAIVGYLAYRLYKYSSPKKEKQQSKIDPKNKDN